MNDDHVPFAAVSCTCWHDVLHANSDDSCRGIVVVVVVVVVLPKKNKNVLEDTSLASRETS